MIASQQLAATQRLVVATGIATIYERAPLIMVAAQRALGEQSGDRFLLGLGCSHGALTQPLFARDYDPPLRAMREYLDRMDAGIAFPGAPASASSPLPRVLAALGPKMLALARDRAQGAHPYFMPPEHTRRAREIRGRTVLCPEVKSCSRRIPRARALALAAGATTSRCPPITRVATARVEPADFASGGSDRLIDATVAWATPRRSGSISTATSMPARRRSASIPSRRWDRRRTGWKCWKRCSPRVKPS